MIIGSRKQIATVLPELKDALSRSEKDFTETLFRKVLSQKVKFPILEYLAREIHAFVPAGKAISLIDRIAATRKIGAYPIAGMMLQLRLEQDFSGSFRKAAEYMMEGDEWYVCDIIGERVFGYALLTQPEKTIPALRKNSRHENQWVVRAVGVATHYAVKKGLAFPAVEEMFRLLLSLSDAQEFHTKRGIGWGAKTVAKFYPALITKYEKEIAASGTWFQTKIRIGLGRSYKYASRYNG